MKTYQVEFQRLTYITYTVKANNKAEAENKAWAEFEVDHPTQIDNESTKLFCITEEPE